MPRGGKREGAGRKKGSRNKRTAEEKALAEARLEPTKEKLLELVHGAKSESVQLGAIREHYNREIGRPRQAEAPNETTIRVIRTYRWARNEAEATLDPSRAKAQPEAKKK